MLFFCFFLMIRRPPRSTLDRSSAASDVYKRQDNLCRLYLSDYLRLWQELLNDIKIKEFDNPGAALDILQVLSGPASPLRALFQTIARETALDRPPAPSPADKTPPADRSLTEKIAGIINKADAPTAAKALSCGVDPRLLGLNGQYGRETGGPEGGIPPLDKTLSALNDLYGHMNAIGRAREASPDGSVAQNLKDQFAGVANQLQVEAARKPPPFNTLLAKLATDSTDIVRSLRDRLNAQWKAAQIAAFFQDNLNGRYPLVRSAIQWSGPGPGGGGTAPAVPTNTIQWAGQTPGAGASRTIQGPPDATLAAFSRFFGPNGLLDSYFKQHLQNYVDTSQGVWRWRGPTGPEQTISPEALQLFQRAAAVRAALFGGNSQTPAVRFQLTPIEASADVGQTLIGLDGQTLTYTVGQAARVADFQWTGASGQARLQFAAPGGGDPLQYSETGPWAWFKLLDQAQMQPVGNGQFRVTFQLGGRQASYELRTAGGNPFRLRELEKLQCPEQL
ncbi:MAG TPA: hypothetical protein DIC59_08870 [Candidatus Competibacteraceae bacterium]|nr:hypothetical protein [Candidatus Competibacteraceae bacterium]